MPLKTRRKKKSKKNAFFLTAVLLGIAMFIFGYSLIFWNQKLAKPKPSVQVTNGKSIIDLWQKLKRRLLDQDLPTTPSVSKRTDILDIGSNSTRESPENSSPSFKDRRRLDNVLQQN